ncbi:MAG: methyl-accepting chemotaxis protein [Solirubrobacteraceae bacterium]
MSRKLAAALLGPAIALLDRLGLARKLVVIALVLIAPALFATWQFRSQQNAQIGFSAKERLGVRELVPAGRLLADLARARSLEVRAAAGDAAAARDAPGARDAVGRSSAALEAVDRELGERLGTRRSWTRLRAAVARTLARPTGTFAALDVYDGLTAATLRLIVQAGNESNLILDPDLDSYYVMDALVNKVPATLDAAGRVSGREVAMVASDRSTEADRILLAVDQGVVNSTIDSAQSGLRTAYARTSDRTLRTALDAPAAGLTGTLASLSAELGRAVHRGPDATAAATLGEDAIGDAATLQARLAPALDRLLAARVAHLRASAQRTYVVVGVGIGLAAYLFLALFLAMTRSVDRMVRAADAIAEGDLEQDLTVRSRDEIGALAQAFARMVAYLREAADAAGRIARGDLTAPPQPRSERDVFGTAFAAMAAQLRTLVGRLSASAGQLASASQRMTDTSREAGRSFEEIAGAMDDMAHGARDQVETVERTRSLAEEMAGASRASADDAIATRRSADEARTLARDGAATVSAASEAMHGLRASSARATDTIAELGARSEQIGSIVATIAGIAEQTDLLALNAAIEAARAGEHGRGFAVVADEVRKLAEESRRATAAVATLVEEVQLQTRRAIEAVATGAQVGEEGANAVEAARASFERIDEAVDAMAERVAQIAAAVDQVADGSDRVRGDIATVARVAERSSASTEQVSASTQQTAAATQEIASSAVELARTADELEALVGSFRLS